MRLFAPADISLQTIFPYICYNPEKRWTLASTRPRNVHVIFNAGEIIKQIFISQFQISLILRQINELITSRKDGTCIIAELRKWKLLAVNKFVNRPCERKLLDAFWRTLS